MSDATQFACNMSALSPGQRSLHRDLIEQLQSALVTVRELPDGYEFEFPLNLGNYDALSQITPLEHACCPFFSIAIRLEAAKLFWQLSGSEGVKPFIRMEFAEWFQMR
jgi:hypothetical protein